MPRLTLRPVALDNFAIVAPSGAVLAILPRGQARDALRALTPPSEARGAVAASRPSSRPIAVNDNCSCERCVA